MVSSLLRKLLAPAVLAIGCSVGLAAPQVFVGTFDELNNSGVTGTARLTLDGTTLNVKIDAFGLLPDRAHPQHIHGLIEGGLADCPTFEQDTNKDGFLSVLEGAPLYGPIKVNLTSPPTPFGPPPDPTLFAPFAGTPDLANFPTAPGGEIHFNQTIVFDLGKPDDAAAFAALTPLNKQHIVIHGEFAPETVDGFGTDPANVIYDPLLPVACTELQAVPLPAAAWTGLGGFAGLMAVGLLRKRSFLTPA